MSTNINTKIIAKKMRAIANLILLCSAFTFTQTSVATTAPQANHHGVSNSSTSTPITQAYISQTDNLGKITEAFAIGHVYWESIIWQYNAGIWKRALTLNENHNFQNIYQPENPHNNLAKEVEVLAVGSAYNPEKLNTSAKVFTLQRSTGEFKETFSFNDKEHRANSAMFFSAIWGTSNEEGKLHQAILVGYEDQNYGSGGRGIYSPLIFKYAYGKWNKIRAPFASSFKPVGVWGVADQDGNLTQAFILVNVGSDSDHSRAAIFKYANEEFTLEELSNPLQAASSIWGTVDQNGKVQHLFVTTYNRTGRFMSAINHRDANGQWDHLTLETVDLKFSKIWGKATKDGYGSVESLFVSGNTSSGKPVILMAKGKDAWKDLKPYPTMDGLIQPDHNLASLHSQGRTGNANEAMLAVVCQYGFSPCAIYKKDVNEASWKPEQIEKP
jgi:hypothetical protein